MNSRVLNGITFAGLSTLVTFGCTKNNSSVKEIASLSSKVTVTPMTKILICPSQPEFSIGDVTQGSFLKASEIYGFRFDSASFELNLAEPKAHTISVSNPILSIVALENKGKETQVTLPANFVFSLGELKEASGSKYRDISLRLPVVSGSGKTHTLVWEKTWDSSEGESIGLASGTVSIEAQNVLFQSAFVEAKECDADAFQGEQPGMLSGTEKIGPKKTKQTEFEHVGKKGGVKISWQGRTGFNANEVLDKTVLTAIDKVQITGLTTEPIELNDAKFGAFHIPAHHNFADAYIINFDRFDLLPNVSKQLKDKNISFLRLRHPFDQDELDALGIDRADANFNSTYVLETLNADGTIVTVVDVSLTRN